MSLQLHDTAARGLKPFVPLDEGRARVYACGPTIYDHAHIGNFRAFVFYDLVHRYLEWSGYDVQFVMNLTDVDDKTIAGAEREGVTVARYTEPFGETFLADSATLGILPADSYPKATEYVGRMVEFIERLLESGHAYRAEDGAVYFSIAAFESYGALKGIDTSSLQVGARVAQDEYEKEDARDFALWKAADSADEATEAAWDAPWGRGRPGWHLECSVMSISELGETLDLHLGGEDLVFPHHENEIAQSEAATGQPFVRTWLHVKHLQLEGKKMSKSAGNFVTVRELLDEGHDPASLRHLLISAHYRSELNFTRAGIEASARAVQRLVDFSDRLASLAVDDSAESIGLPLLADEAVADVRRAMDNDLGTPEALGALFTLITRVNAALDSAAGVPSADRDAVIGTVESLDRIFGLLAVAREARVVEDDLAVWVEEQIAARAAARADRDFAKADEIRDELASRGIVLEDGPDGTRWKVTG